ncbi:MAG TPA: O-antigen ligase family protein [Allosphingosinicella sp.]|jgi:O-antigen ligase
MIHNLRLGLTPFYLLLCLLLGGASAAGFWANMTLQLLALPILFWALVVRRQTPISTPSRQLLIMFALLVVLGVAQLIPLPPSVWTVLPGRQTVVEGFALLNQPLPWMPVSLSPQRTIASLLWLLPAAAVFLGIVRVGAFRANWFAWALAGVTIASVLLGALQIAGGGDTGWYLYTVTNVGKPTGFFSNANHFATLMVSTIPFLAALYLNGASKGRSVQRTSGMFVVLGGIVSVVLLGIAINGSVAGIGLTVPVAVATALMVLSRTRRLPKWAPFAVGLLVFGFAAAVFSTPFSNNVSGEEGRASQQTRQTSFTRTIDLAGDFFPLGSGIGTYGEVYPSTEDPASVTRTYMNHVHGDYIELALETGLPGLLLIGLFLVWWVRRSVHIWRADEPDYFARAACITSAAILAHSLVDYPLRTAAIAAVFAMCCALMAEPRAKVRPSRRGRRSDESKPAALHLSAD